MPRFNEKPVAMALCSLLLCCACSSDEAGSQKHSDNADAGGHDAGDVSTLDRWVGDVTDSDVRVAVVADTAHARVFFCGGPDSYATATRWFTLDIEDGAVSFDDDGWRVSARLEPAAISGEVAFGGATHAFSASAVVRDTLAGLYQGQAECGRLGLIVQQTKKTAPIRAQGACVGPEHDPQQVNPILPIALKMDEIAVEAPSHAGQRVGLRVLDAI